MYFVYLDRPPQEFQATVAVHPSRTAQEICGEEFEYNRKCRGRGRWGGVTRGQWQATCTGGWISTQWGELLHGGSDRPHVLGDGYLLNEVSCFTGVVW